MTTLARPSLLSRMARLFAAQAKIYCFSTLIVGLLGIVALTAITLAAGPPAGEGAQDPASLWRSMSFSHQMMFIFSLIFAIWMPMLLAARGTCRITTDQLTAQPVSPGKVFGDMAMFIPAALVYSLIIGLASMIGFGILILPGIFVASLFVLVIPTRINESSGIFAALRRGIALSMRIWNKTLLLTFVSGALVVLIVVLRNIFLDRFLLSQHTLLIVVRLAVAYLPALLVLILANISFVLLYHEAREMEAPLLPTPPSSLEGQVLPPPLV